MTLFVNEGCDYRTHLLMGLYPDLDLVSMQMYCALYEASDYSTSKADIDKQRWGLSCPTTNTSKCHTNRTPYSRASLWHCRYC
jgi:hypothetical protein